MKMNGIKTGIARPPRGNVQGGKAGFANTMLTFIRKTARVSIFPEAANQLDYHPQTRMN